MLDLFIYISQHIKLQKIINTLFNKIKKRLLKLLKLIIKILLVLNK